MVEGFDKEFHKHLTQIDLFEIICLKDTSEYYEIVRKWLVEKQDGNIDISPYKKLIDSHRERLKEEMKELYKIRRKHGYKL